jgi:N-acetylglucosaminyldiphosphoundecaprenol N-acetyl-beta-D-mannosaminyltransferase
VTEFKLENDQIPMVGDERKRVKILDLLIDVVTLQTAADRIRTWVLRKEKAYVCVAPVATVVSALDDVNYRQVVNSAGMVTPDGMPVVWAARMRGTKGIERVYGPDLMRTIFADASFGRAKHFFFGATDETLSLLQKQLKTQHSHLQIVGGYAPPFRPNAQREDQAVIDKINQAQPDILWVGLGSPKQDFWMSIHRNLLNATVIIGIGAAFDFLAGVKPQAPRWMQRSGLEWLFRLCCEPRRLWRRYLIGNIRFCWEMGKEMIGLR